MESHRYRCTIAQTAALIIYSKQGTVLPDEVLDKKTWEVGKYLLKRYIVLQKMFDMTPEDQPDIDLIEGPQSKELQELIY